MVFEKEVSDLLTAWENKPDRGVVPTCREDILWTMKALLPNHLPAQDILAPYGEERRKYHGYCHLWDMISVGTGDPFFPIDLSPSLLLTAILGHDHVYKYLSVSTENEVMSAVRTTSLFELKGKDALTVGRAIFATAKHHENLSTWATEFEKELLDRDLYSFAKPYPSFRSDSESVVEEIFYSAGEACEPKSRDKILEGQCTFYGLLLMSRPTIYYRHVEWESQARQNLSQYLNEVRSGL